MEIISWDQWIQFEKVIDHLLLSTEAKAFSAALGDFKKKGAEVFGISSVRAPQVRSKSV